MIVLNGNFQLELEQWTQKMEIREIFSSCPNMVLITDKNKKEYQLKKVILSQKKIVSTN